MPALLGKDKMKRFLLLTLILITPQAFAFDNYVSPESYAVNEADFTDYRYIPPSPKLNLETLETLEQPAVEVEITKQRPDRIKKMAEPKVSKKDDPEAYKKRLSYKFAKWWVDKRYEREEPHHGVKHEIKVKAREEYEKQLKEQASQESI